jgi:hypothetical protein
LLGFSVLFRMGPDSYCFCWPARTPFATDWRTCFHG